MLINKNKIYSLFLLTIIFSCGGAYKDFVFAEQQLSGCISGIVAPADEFCAEHSQKFQKASTKMENELKVLATTNQNKYNRLKPNVDSVRAHLAEVIEKVF